jgi:PadR family transcriptional regulator PadR
MKITKIDNEDQYHDLYTGLIRLHILHHAAEEPIFGLGMSEELARHGYRISPGTLYPLLQGMEKRGYLRSTVKRNGRSIRKVYRATPLGRKALKAMRVKVGELFGEINERKERPRAGRLPAVRNVSSDGGADGRRTSVPDR